jgi:beta-aspartyl-peptidase (threonine type)
MSQRTFAQNSYMSQKLSLVIHGGSGTVLRSHLTTDQESDYLTGLNDALIAGKTILTEGGTSLDAVTAAVSSLEDCPMYNAGRGSVYASDGSQEMDASIMTGNDQMAGAVAMVKGVKNPIQLARKVMENSGHVFLAGHGAEEFARAQNVVAATSTGGMTNKKFGRVGDSSIIGSGTYANNQTCAVSCTGSGEYFIRGVVAYDVSCLIEYQGLTLQQSCDKVIHDRLIKLGGDGGLIAVDTQGNIALPFNTDGMYRGYWKDGKTVTKIFKED